MSKTAQRKREYFMQGVRDGNAGYSAFTPFWDKTHPFNRAYMDGFHWGRRNAQLSKNNSLLQWFRVKFWTHIA